MKITYDFVEMVTSERVNELLGNQLRPTRESGYVWARPQIPTPKKKKTVNSRQQNNLRVLYFFF